MLKISAFRFDNNEFIIDGDAENSNSIGWLDISKKLTKSKIQTKNGQSGKKNATEEPKFLISKVRKALNHLM